MIIQWVIFAIAALCVAAVASVTYVAVALPGCDSCHTDDKFVADTAAAPHASVDCVDCHVDDSVSGRVSFATREVFHMTIPVVPDVDRSAAAVNDRQCLACHEEIEGPAVLGSRGLRIKHQSCIGDSSCGDCHSATGHGESTTWPRVALMSGCYDCHGRTNRLTDCDTCHEDRDERQRILDGPFRVTHGPEWQQTHGMGDMNSCSACHTSDKCAKCHGVGVPHEGDFVTLHPDFSTQSNAKCTTCHVQQFCDDCHTYPMPHSQKFVLEHSKTVEKDGKERCLTCHNEGDCVQCHVDHVHPVTQEQMDGFMLKSPGGGQ